MNEQLKLNTFLTSNTIQLPDLMLTFVLFYCFNDVLTQDKREKIPNVIRMFKFVSHMKQFVDIFGESIPCQMQKTPKPYKPCLEEEVKPEESKKDKKNKKKNK